MSKNKRKALPEGEKKADKKAAVFKLVTLIFVTGGVFAVYRILMQYKYFEIVLGAYLVALTALLVGYIIYNRGMTRKSITVDMLPDDWSYERKIEYIEEAERRRKGSSWMLIFIFAFIFTFAFEMLELFVLPWLDKILS